MSQKRLMFEPAARHALLRGFNKLVAAMEVTLGPRGRVVAVGRDNRLRAPELLDDGAIIARRFAGFPDRFETMGAFLARHIAWQVEEAVGDGATTAVVIARAILNAANRHVAAGYNVMSIRRGLEKALDAVSSELDKLTQPLESPAQITALATSITGSETIGRLVEEIFDVVGEHGAVDVRSNYGLTHSCRYINGTFWNQGWVSSYFATEGETAVVKEPYILLTNRVLDTAAELVPILEQVGQIKERGLVVFATDVRGDALNILVTNKARGRLPTLAIKAPGLGLEKTEILQDLSVLTGGRMFLTEAGERVETATLADLGQAREVQAIRSGFTLLGGHGRPAAIRERSQELRRQIADAAYGYERNQLVQRSGKLLGGVALLEIGGATETERDYLKERAQEAVRVVRLGLQDGIVPGGGVAFLRCLSALETLCLPDDQAIALPIMELALTAPLRAILRNSGLEPDVLMDQIRRSDNGCGYDVVHDQLTDMVKANIVDPVQVLQTALRAGLVARLWR